MSEVFADATAALAATLAGVCGLAVTYRRGESAVKATAWRSYRTGEVTDETGALVAYESWDWFLEVAALGDPASPAGGLGLPEPGDAVVTAGGEVYELIGQAGQKHFQWAGPSGTLLRIHAKHVATEAG